LRDGGDGEGGDVIGLCPLQEDLLIKAIRGRRSKRLGYGGQFKQRAGKRRAGECR